MHATDVHTLKMHTLGWESVIYLMWETEHIESRRLRGKKIIILQHCFPKQLPLEYVVYVFIVPVLYI